MHDSDDPDVAFDALATERRRAHVERGRDA